MARHKDQDLGSLNRKGQILDAAANLFANNGFYKTTTAMVAAEVGVTQPYVFHFFKSKELLYLAVLERAIGRLVEAFRAVEAPPEKLADRMGNAFNELMETHRDEILLCMHSFATPEPEVRAFVREQFASIHEFVARRFADAGLPHPGPLAAQFIACGMVISMGEVLDLPQLKRLDPGDGDV
ncbi:TetR/AcrR family transcriptional regulator [Paenibacillus sp. XY044]|uniref:TetR/AcrR family transcriptional regulator n=1 Tax=Paenibacillus sp. XY044 TaxID=2026089 RepID=UPI000B997B38|nr:TetR/AcrR family transcriptional regulator [Paenibacillus sp. XY044]OZB93663.1 TetR family transcriptional regulator [Paenibacillus sp. XY044]